MSSDPETLLKERAWLKRLSARLVGSSDADDLAQEVTLEVLRQQARNPSAFPLGRGWLTGVARMKALRQWRRDGSRRERERIYLEESTTAGLPAVAQAADELAETAEMERHVVKELLSLREPIRSTLLFRYQAGLSAAEIARSTGVPDGTVRRRIKTGLDELRERMNERFGGLAAWGPVLLGKSAVLAKAPGAAGMAITSWITMKKLALVLGLLLLGIAWTGVGPWASTTTSPAARPAEPLTLAPLTLAEVSSVQESETARSAVPISVTGQSPAWALRVVDAEGEPVAITQALAQVGAERLALGPATDGRLTVTDEQGETLAQLPGGSLALVVSRENAWPRTFMVDVTGGKHTLVWPKGNTVRGRLMENGASPGEPVDLTLHRDLGWSGRAAALALETREEPIQRAVTTNADGTFAILDLPEDWRGWLTVGQGWTFATLEQDSETFDSEVSTLPNWSVERLTRIHGRVVEAGSNRPIAGALVIARGSPSWSTSNTQSEVTDGDGRFECFARPSVSTQIILGGDPELRERELEPVNASVGQIIDLGDLEVEPATVIRLTILGAAGEPLEGAQVREAQHGEWLDAKTDVHGRLDLFVNAIGQMEVDVFAADHERRIFRLPVPASGSEMDLRLERALSIDLAVVDHQENPVAGASVAFSFLLRDRDDVSLIRAHSINVVRGRSGGGVFSTSGEPPGVRMCLRTDESGKIVLDGYPLDAKVTCGFRGEDGTWLTRPLVVTPDSKGAFRGTLRTTEYQTRAVTGTVRAASGAPIAGARVTLKRPEYQSVLTDAKGAFLVNVRADAPDFAIEVQSPRFRKLRVALPSPKSAHADELLGLDIRLDSGRELNVALKLPNGEVPSLSSFSVEQETLEGGWRRSVDHSPLTHGETRVHGLAPGPVLLRARYKETWHEVIVPAGLAEWDFVIHDPQPITVTWEDFSAQSEVRFRHLLSVQPEWPGLIHSLDGEYVTEENRADRSCVLMAAPGTYRIDLGTANDMLASRSVRVEPGQPATVTFTD